MVFCVFLFGYLLYRLRGNLIYKIFTALFVSIFQLVMSMVLARVLGYEGINASLFYYDKEWFSLEVFALSFFVAVLLLIMVMTVDFFVNKKEIATEKFNWSYKKIILLLITGIPILLGSIGYFGAVWIMKEFGNVGIEEIIYTMSQPLKGTDSGQIFSFIEGPLLNAIFISSSLIYAYILISPFLDHIGKSSRALIISKKIVFSTLSLGIFFVGIVLGVQEIGYADIKSYFFEKTTIYEEYFVSPLEVDLSFPEKKRNLVYIFVESLESTFFSYDIGGGQEENLLPNLSQLAQKEISFSHSDYLGGALNVPGTGFTVGAMVAQTTGVPLKVTGSYSANDYGSTSSYMPGITSLGDILEENGYYQELIIGSDASFAGRDKYFSQHGNYEIVDYNYAKKMGWIPEDYKEWWGYEDEKLFEFAKERLSEISELEQPFNFTLLTADTHFPHGYMGENTPVIYENQYSNVIHYADSMLYDFIMWMQNQPFYENTTIILTGDHLSMDTDFFVDLSSEYERTIFNLFMNTPTEPVTSKNRGFSSLDLFPTTLSALGVEITGDRLGLGTNLFSTRDTIIEELGFEKVSEELRKNSTFYNTKIMQGSDLEAGKNNKEKK